MRKILVHKQNVLPGVKEIILAAFGVKQFAGGIVGISLSKIIGKGFSLGMFSNEAGMGSAPNAAAAADVSHPVKQGLIQTLGIYFITFVTREFQIIHLN